MDAMAACESCGNNILDSAEADHRPLLRGGQGAFPYHEGANLILAAKWFVRTDESGTHPKSLACVVAGYVATPRAWKEFDKAWRAALGPIDCFHGNIFYNRHKNKDPKENPYLKWSDRKAKDFEGGLLKVIDKHKITPVGAGVEVKAFQSLSYGDRCVLAGYLAQPRRRKSRDPVPYHLAFRGMLLDTIGLASTDTEIHVLIAEQLEYQQRAGEVYKMTKASYERGYQLESFGTRLPIKVPGLQAADLLARHWANYLTFGPKRLNKESSQTMNILARKRDAIKLFDRAQMDLLLSYIPPDEREAMRSYGR